jgi:hypothetical protein
MKKIQQIILVGVALALVQNTNAQGLLQKLAQKANSTSSSSTNKSSSKAKEVKPVLANVYAKDFNDDLGISGIYYVLDTIWLNVNGSPWSDTRGGYGKKTDEKGNPYYVDKVKLSFEREVNDKVVNLLCFWYSEFDSPNTGDYGPKLDEKLYKNSKTIQFNSYPMANHRTSYTEVEKGVIVKIASGDNFETPVVTSVYAKDKAMLSTYDKETGLAKVQQIMNAANKEKYLAEKKKWLENETYKKMAGKIGFVKHYNETGATYGKITEKPDVFISSFDLNKKVYYRAYYDMPPTTLCSDGCAKNVIFEMEGKKVSLLELRKSNSKWSSKLKKDSPDQDFFSMCPTLYGEQYTSNYAFLYLLYINKEKFTGNKSFKIKMTITNNRDGVDTDILATGQINLEYKDTDKGTFQFYMDLVDKLEN